MMIRVENLKKYFILPSRDVVHAVDGVSFTINKGETLGLVGESGCGKTTIGRCVLRLIEYDDGKVFFNGENIKQLNSQELRLKRKEMRIILQDPFSSLDPRMTVFQLVSEPFIIHKMRRKSVITEKTLKLLNSVGLDRHDIINKYPHELDGGRCQRVGIARALALDPEFIVCDEPVSSLDVSLQAQIINLLMDLQKEHCLTYIFISHNISVIKHISDFVLVMYLGKAMEYAPKNELFKNPMHPYTKALLDSIPSPLKKNKMNKPILTGEVPTPINPGPGCRFAARCSKSMEICKKSAPCLYEVSKNHKVACFHFEK